MNDTESFSPEEQRVLDECLAVIKNGPAVAEVIGPAIDRIQSDRLDRAVANIETLLAISTNMEPEDGLRLWEEWKLTAPGRSGKADLKHRERVSQVVGQAASPPVVLTAVISECLASPEPTPDRKKEDTANRADRSENVCPIGHRCPDQLLKAASPKKSALPTSSSSCRESPPKTKPTANTGPQDALSASAPNTPNQVPAKLDEGTPDAEATTSAPFVLEAAAAADSTVQKQEQVSGMALQQVATNKSEVEIVYGPLKGTYRVHPCGALYPAMEGQPYIDLKKSVQRFGQRESIVLDGDVLLDGKNRLRVMNELGREPSVVQFRKLQTGMTPDQFIEGKNHRRNISEDQRLMILAKISAWRKEEALRRRASVACCSRSDSGSAGPENKPGAASNDEYRQEPADIPKAGRGRPKGRRNEAKELAAAVNVSRFTAERALKVRDEAPELAEAVQHGDLKLREAAQLVDQKKAQPPAIQGETATHLPDTARIEKTAVAAMNLLRALARKRRLRIDELTPFWLKIAEMAAHEANSEDRGAVSMTARAK